METAAGVLLKLSDCFLSKLSDISTILDLSQASDPEKDSYLQVIEQCMEETAGLAHIVRLLKLEVDKQKNDLERFKDIKEKFIERKAIIEFCSQSIPDHLPKPKHEHASEVPKSKPKILHQEPQVNPAHLQASKIQSNQRKPYKSVYVPTVEYITVEDFDTVPKYMKGRINYNQINHAVDELNKAYKEKYKILGMKRSALNDVNRKRVEVYKRQETNNTADEHFIVDGDIKEFANYKLDSVGRNILTILRHCGRIKEIRGGGHTRFAVIDVY